jgi:hypothetical protein
MSDTKNPRPDRPTQKPSHPGMMGDGTEEQNLGQPGDPEARITEEEVEKAFGERDSKRPQSKPPTPRR